jgi:hypothetical protein
LDDDEVDGVVELLDDVEGLAGALGVEEAAGVAGEAAG